MQGPFLLADKMKDADKTIHKKHKGCSVAAEKPESLSTFLGTLAADNNSQIQTVEHFRKNMSLFIQALHLIIMPLTSIGGCEMYGIHLEKKEHLLDFVGDKENKNKLNKFYS